MTSEEKEVCPLCMEPMEADDLAFYPCDCRYQVCRFCWAKIINEGNGLCPACRKEYNSEKPAMFKPVSESDDSKLRSNRRRKDNLKKTKLNAEMLKLLPELRVVQPNLIFVVGLPAWICKDKDVLKGPEYFGRYGKVFKVEINQNQTFGGPQGQPSFSAYITFCRAEDAMRSIKELDQGMLQGRSLRVSLGTTKYCSQFLRGTKCTKHECMYLHELGDPAASFTKEEMQAGKHTEYMNKLLSEYTPSTSSSGTAPSHESSSYAPASLDEGSSYPKESYAHTSNRFRVRTDLGSERPSGSCPLKSTGRGGHTRALTDPEPIPSGSSGDTRRTRHVKSDHIYSDFAVHDSSNESALSPCDKSAKANAWNRQLSTEYLQSSSQKHASSKSLSSSFSQVYTNGLSSANVDKCTRISKKPSDIRRIQSSEPSCNASCRKSLISEAYSAPINNTAFVGSPAEDEWYRSSPPSDGENFGDDPIDIGFDPFLESQQGLAELLAAEVGKIGLTGEETTPNMFDINGHGANSGPCSGDSGTSLSNATALNPNISDFRSNQTRRVCYPWMSDFIPSGTGSHAELTHQNSGYVFPKIYPPPGFEDTARVLQRSTDPSAFSSSHPESLLTFESSDSGCSIGAGRNSDVGNNTSSSGTTAYSFAHVSCNAGNKLDSTFDAFSQTRHSKSIDSDSHYRSLSSNFVNSPEVNHSFSAHEQVSQRPESLASLFTAAFNTATAMLSQRTANSGDKSNQCAQKAPSTNFDLTAFFNQLCRLSPFFSSLAATQSVNDWSTLLGSNGVSVMNNNGTRSSANISDPLLDSTNPTALAAAAAAASVLLPSVQFPSRYDTLSNEDNNCQINVPNYSFPPGLSKFVSNRQQEIAEVRSDKNQFVGSPSGDSSTEPAVSNSPLTWQLDDPAIVSSQLAPGDNRVEFSPLTSTWKGVSSLSFPSELLQQSWRSGSGMSPLFNPQSAPGLGFSTNQDNINNVAVRDTSLHSVSNNPQSRG